MYIYVKSRKLTYSHTHTILRGKMEKKIYCAILNNWCNHVGEFQGRCGGVKATPLHSGELLSPCITAASYVDKQLKSYAEGGSKAQYGSFDENSYHGNVLTRGKRYSITITSGSILEIDNPQS